MLRPDSLVLPEKFERRVALTWGEDGRSWLDALPNILTTCEQRWGVSIKSPVADLSYNFVATAVASDGTEVIVKIGVPDPELFTEMEALQHYQGRQAVTLLAADRDLGALLLRRLLPGKPLSTLTNDEQATTIAAALMRDLPLPEPEHHHLPSVGRWALAFKRLRSQYGGQTGPLPLRLVEKAERLFQELQASSPSQMLLHGDLHHDNILFSEGTGWLAIDPKGVIGDPAYEAARFQHNPIPRFLSMDRPQQAAENRIKIIASILGIDRSRLLGWAFFDAVLTACWSAEEDSDGWQYGIACAEIFDKMVG